MRIAWMIAALIAGCAASPAAADITARYSWPELGGSMIIQVNHRGDAKVSLDGRHGEAAALILGGEVYLVETDSGGTIVVRRDDQDAVFREESRGMTEGLQAEPDDDFELIEGGEETVAGRRGIVWTLRARGQWLRDSLPDFVIVVSSDPDLAPIGRVFARLDDGDGPLSRAMRRLLKGSRAAIRMGTTARLESTDAEPIPVSAFALPSTPLTRAEYAARRSARMRAAD